MSLADGTPNPEHYRLLAERAAIFAAPAPSAERLMRSLTPQQRDLGRPARRRRTRP